jgi:hypothetical protein
MDLKRPGFALLAAFAFSGCGEDFSVSDDAVPMPGTLQEAFPLALRVASDWSDDGIVDASDGSTFAFIQSAGGGFTVMDANGRARNHSFQFHSRRKLKNLTVHLFGGIPWTQEVTDPVPPPPIFVALRPFSELLDSDVVVPAAIEQAASLNALHPDSIPAATDYAARMLSIPVWPEQEFVGQETDSLAWRVDFLVVAPFGGSGTTTYFSVARFYSHPISGQFLGDPVVPPEPEVYPFPDGFP